MLEKKNNKEVEKIKYLVRNVDGFLTDREGRLLYKLASQCKGKGVIVEIGSWKGKSTIWIAKGAKRNNLKVYAIDPHTGSSEHQQKYGEVWTFKEFLENIKKADVKDMIVPIINTSYEARKLIDEPVEFIFIDGEHEYEFVKMDYQIWFPLIIEGGFIAFHDATWESVRRLVDNVLKLNCFRNVYFYDTLVCAQKVKNNSPKDRIKNRSMVFLKNQFGYACSSFLPKPIRKMWKSVIKMFRYIVWKI